MHSKHMKKIGVLFLGMIFLAAAAAGALCQAQKVSHDVLIGTWDLELDADGENFYLTMVIEETNEALKGKISEESGFFTDAVLEELAFDGKTLTFSFNAPTPPDGEERALMTELTITGDSCEGILSIEDLGISVDISGKKQK